MTSCGPPSQGLAPVHCPGEDGFLTHVKVRSNDFDGLNHVPAVRISGNSGSPADYVYEAGAWVGKYLAVPRARASPLTRLSR